MQVHRKCVRSSPSSTVGSSAIALCSPPPVALCANARLLSDLCLYGTALVINGACSTLHVGLSAILCCEGLKRKFIAENLLNQADAVFPQPVRLLVEQGF